VNRECVGSSFEVRDLDGFEEQLSKLIRLCSYGCDNFVKKKCRYVSFVDNFMFI
jgi:hypothetical protein